MHEKNYLYKKTLEHSYTKFPKKETEDEPTWKTLDIDPNIFYIDGKYEATFEKHIPTTALDELATKATKDSCNLNNVEYNENSIKCKKRCAFYFYQYLALYHKTAAENHNIIKQDKETAMNYLAHEPIDIDYLARVITYYDLILDKTPSMPQIRKFFKETALPEAEEFLKKKFNLNYQSFDIDDTLFFAPSQPPFQEQGSEQEEP
jgi:hypothetical protein